MRVWDVAAGYLTRPKLLAEHRDVHALYSMQAEGGKRYARLLESLRWQGCTGALARRHDALVAEMALRGYGHRTPIETRARIRWPASYVTPPDAQFQLLRKTYGGRAAGRIPVPHNVQTLWAHHKYSVMARDPALCRSIGRQVSCGVVDAAALAAELVAILRLPPARGRLINAIEHMWGHVVEAATAEEKRLAGSNVAALFSTTQALAMRRREPYLIASTALSELAVFVVDT